MLNKRRASRKSRRARKTRYRASRFNNRIRHEGWLTPSLHSRVDNVISWVRRYQLWVPISGIVIEAVRFDIQKLLNPGISNAEYRQGTLFSYELREYLLEKFQRTCVYCGSENVRLEIDHVQPRSKGGTMNPNNLVLACHGCNRAKWSQPIEDFLANNPERLKRIKSQLQTSLRATAAINATRTKILLELFRMHLPVEVSTGGETKFNRTRLSIPKSHALDAACTGKTQELLGWNMSVLSIKACGRGSYQRTLLDKYGFPRGFLIRKKKTKGFQTGDIVRASVSKGKKAGVHIGRVAVRASGSFNIQTANTTIQGINYRHCRLVQRADGYNYKLLNTSIPSATKVVGLLA